MRRDDVNFSLAFSRALGNVIVHVHGSLDRDTANELRERLIDTIDGQGNLQVVVDVRGMTSIDSAGFRVLGDALKRIRRRGGELVVSGPTSAVTRAFEAAGLDEVFVMTPAWAHPVHGSISTHLDIPRRRGHG
jgi:anti-anti-sigma factor